MILNWTASASDAIDIESAVFAVRIRKQTILFFGRTNDTTL